MTDTDDTILNQLPGRLRLARREQGLSLDAVAKLSGVSRSMVSQIERGESSPTIATLWNLTRALQVDFAGLLDGGPSGDRVDVVRKVEIPTIDNKDAGCQIRILSAPEDAGHQELYELLFDADGKLDSLPHKAGAREQVSVISGTLEIRSGTATTRVGPGDTARYAADVAHSITAVGGEARVFLSVRDA